MQTAPLIFGILIGIVISLGAALIFGLWRSRVSSRARHGEPTIEMRDDLLIGFLVLAAFTLGVFLTYALLNLHP
jgi:hypothetical protein